MLRVLAIAEAANPELTSVALIGYSLSRALGTVCEVHLVTEKRNEQSLLAAGVHPDSFTAISNPAQSVAFHLANSIRGGNNLGWTILSALSNLVYPWFEHRVWEKFGHRLKSKEFDLVHRITPLSPTAPSPIARKLSTIGVPLVIGPLNGGIPWPQGFDSVRIAEREWLGYFRGLYRLTPGTRTTRRLASAIVVASRHTLQEVTGDDPSLTDKAIWIPENGIDPKRFPKITAPRPAPKEDGPLHVAFLGRLVPYKGADLLIEAAAPLIREGKLHLKIIGDGPQMPELRNLVLREGIENSVEFTGWVPHESVRHHLSTSSVFAFPSVREFGGGVVLEAMALGLMPIVLDYGGPAELIPPGCGLIVPIGSPAEIIDSFRKVLAELHSQPGTVHEAGIKAQQYVRDHFTWEAKARQLLEIYHWVAERKSSAKPAPLDLATPS